MNYYGNIEIVMEGKRMIYVLSVGIDFEKNDIKYMPSLSLYESYGDLNQKNVFIWDNEDYLYNIFYKEVILPWVDNEEIKNKDEFVNFIKEDGVNIEDFKILKKGFDKAVEMKFFN